MGEKKKKRGERGGEGGEIIKEERGKRREDKGSFVWGE